ncbi:MAG: hypothetical protein ACTHLL_05960 [Candidatus Nitrosocosmicus sp.]
MLKREGKDGMHTAAVYYKHIQNFLHNKTNLFVILSILFTSIIFYPLILPHLYHTSMIIHIAIHILSLNFALFLVVISIISFKKTKSKRVLLTSLSFGVLLAVEFLYLLQSSGTFGDFQIPYIDVEMPHILLLFMLTLFAAGIIRVERK